MAVKASEVFFTSTKGNGSKAKVYKIEAIVVDEYSTEGLTVAKALERVGSYLGDIFADDYKDWSIKVTPSTFQEFEALSK